MSVNEDSAEGSISSLLLESLANTQNGGAFSSEDIAWADSCLLKDPEISAGEWSSVKDALLEVLSLVPESQDASSGAMITDGSVGGTEDVLMLPLDEDLVTEQPSLISGDDDYRVTIGGEPNLNINTTLSKEEMDVLYSLQFLVQDPETFNGDWNSMQDAVERILSLRPKESGENAMTLLHEVEDAQSSTGTDRDFDEETKMKSQHGDRETAEGFQVGTLLSTYKDENPKETEQSDLPTSSSAEDAGVTTSEIFKLWDLGITAEEEEEDDELIKKLKRAVADSSIQSIAPVVDDSEAMRDLKEGALDYLIAGIGDLSIQQHSG